MLMGPDGKLVFGMVKVGEKGQIVIPKDARQKFDIKPGDSLMLVGDEKTGLALLTSESLKSFFSGLLGENGAEETNERH
ncbi:MAG: AbrB/MazE/SpoVT family DNA-binding domain-containing protein [Clostridiaceae bacterium]|nr:AbrB/MazE/SpoVT family DNA-binding domain-containing protein [Clostridiaceae bacterium]